MALPKNRNGVTNILDTISPRILGVKKRGYVAKELVPGGNKYPGQEVMWTMWSVRAVSEEAGKPDKLMELYDFIPLPEIEALFEANFADTSGNDPEAGRYDPPMDEGMMAKAGFEAHVSIRRDQTEITFRFSFGKEQDLALKMDTAHTRRGFYLLKLTDSDVAEVLEGLKTLEPKTYKGGPDPELEYESEWLIDYREALKLALSAAHVRVGPATSLVSGRKYLISGEITFLF